MYQWFTIPSTSISINLSFVENEVPLVPRIVLNVPIQKRNICGIYGYHTRGSPSYPMTGTADLVHESELGHGHHQLFVVWSSRSLPCGETRKRAARFVSRLGSAVGCLGYVWMDPMDPRFNGNLATSFQSLSKNGQGWVPVISKTPMCGAQDGPSGFFPESKAVHLELS